ADELPRDAAAALFRQHAHTEEREPREARRRADAAPGVDAIGCGEQQQPPVLIRRPQLLGRDRLAGDDARLDRRPALVVRLRRDDAQLDHPERLSLPRFFAYRSPALKTTSPIGIENAPITSSGHTSAHARPVPCSTCCRLPRSAYVAGEIFAIHCIQPGSTLTG